MLVEIKKLQIQNIGHKRDISIQKMYINTNNIVSIGDYEGVLPFLISEKSGYSENSFSLIKVNTGSGTEDIIALGSSKEIFESFRKSKDKRLLNE